MDNLYVWVYTKSGQYSKASPCLNSVDDHWISKIYIEQVNLNLMSTAEHGFTYRALQKRVMINFTKEACGRGGEVKFQKHSEWNFKHYSKIFGPEMV